jgi:hypothetical protein
VQHEANELRRLEYQRRQQTGALLRASREEPRIIESLTKQTAEQRAKIRSLMQEVERRKSEKVVLHQSADPLARLQAEAASEVTQVLQRKTSSRMGRTLQMKIVGGLKTKNRG